MSFEDLIDYFYCCRPQDLRAETPVPEAPTSSWLGRQVTYIKELTTAVISKVQNAFNSVMDWFRGNTNEADPGMEGVKQQENTLRNSSGIAPKEPQEAPPKEPQEALPKEPPFKVFFKNIMKSAYSISDVSRRPAFYSKEFYSKLDEKLKTFSDEFRLKVIVNLAVHGDELINEFEANLLSPSLSKLRKAEEKKELFGREFVAFFFIKPSFDRNICFALEFLELLDKKINSKNLPSERFEDLISLMTYEIYQRFETAFNKKNTSYSSREIERFLDYLSNSPQKPLIQNHRERLFDVGPLFVGDYSAEDSEDESEEELGDTCFVGKAYCFQNSDNENSKAVVAKAKISPSMEVYNSNAVNSLKKYASYLDAKQSLKAEFAKSGIEGCMTLANNLDEENSFSLVLQVINGLLVESYKNNTNEYLSNKVLDVLDFFQDDKFNVPAEMQAFLSKTIEFLIKYVAFLKVKEFMRGNPDMENFEALKAELDSLKVEDSQSFILDHVHTHIRRAFQFKNHEYSFANVEALLEFYKNSELRIQSDIAPLWIEEEKIEEELKYPEPVIQPIQGAFWGKAYSLNDEEPVVEVEPVVNLVEPLSERDAYHNQEMLFLNRYAAFLALNEFLPNNLDLDLFKTMLEKVDELTGELQPEDELYAELSGVLTEIITKHTDQLKILPLLGLTSLKPLYDKVVEKFGQDSLVIVNADENDSELAREAQINEVGEMLQRDAMYVRLLQQGYSDANAQVIAYAD